MRFGVWRDFGRLVCAQGETRVVSLKKVGIKARVVENRPQGARGGSMGVESRENMREESKNSKKASR